MSADPVKAAVDGIYAIGRELGIPPSPSKPVRVQPRGRRTARDRRKVADAMGFITGRAASKRERLTDRQLAEIHRRYANTAGLVERHEAAHAIVAMKLGVRVDYLTASRTGREGVTALTRDLSDPDVVLPIVVAGLVGERSHHSWHAEYGAMWEHSDDAERLREWLNHYGRTDAERAEMRRRAEDRVGEILWRERRWFERVADALQRHHRLDRDALDALR